MSDSSDDEHDRCPKSTTETSINTKHKSMIKWLLDQTNGTEHVVPCPYISNDKLELRELMPPMLYGPDGKLRVVSVDEQDTHENTDQIIGYWRSGWSDLELAIRQWRWDLIGTDFTLVFYGKRREGKTHMMEPILYQLRPYFPYVVVFTKTGFNGDLARMFPKSLILGDFNDTVINAILDEQQQRVAASKASPEPRPNCRLLLVFDDVLSAEVAYRYSKSMERLFYEGRHYKICCICTSQDAKGLPPALKQNTDVHISFPMQGLRERQTFAENSLPFLTNDRDVRAFLREVQCFKHQAFFIVNCRGSRPLDQQVYTGIATPKPEIPRFVMGTYMCWKDDLQQLADSGFEYLRDDPSLETWNIEPYMPIEPPAAPREDGMRKKPIKRPREEDSDDRQAKRGAFSFIHERR